MKSLEQIADEIGQCVFRIETYVSTLSPSEVNKRIQLDLERLKEIKSELLNMTNNEIEKEEFGDHE
jgi:hypothetical protein